MPITNAEAGTYFLLGAGWVQDSGSTNYGNIQVTINLNCSVETLTPPLPQGPFSYTFHAAQEDFVIDETTSSDPICVVFHYLSVESLTIPGNFQ